MRFEITHELDAPLDALELALMSPDFGPLMVDALVSIESVEPRDHTVEDGSFHRVWRYQAKAPLKVLSSKNITRDMMRWDEEWTYRLDDHAATWKVVPRPDVDMDAPWRERFVAEGTYRLDPLADGRTRRTVQGHLTVPLRLVGTLVERVALKELRRAYDAEVGVLQQLCSLG